MTGDCGGEYSLVGEVEERNGNGHQEVEVEPRSVNEPIDESPNICRSRDRLSFPASEAE